MTLYFEVFLCPLKPKATLLNTKRKKGVRKKGKLSGHLTMLNLSFYSIWCRTVEVNNTDAEGRLVLGDGVRPVYMQNIFILVVDHSSVTNRHSETMEDRA